MSRIDTTTIVIVVILFLALGVLGYQLYKLYQEDDQPPSLELQDYEDSNALPESDYYDAPEEDGELYNYDTQSEPEVAGESDYLPPPEPEPSTGQSTSGFTVDEESLPRDSYGDYLVLAGSFEYEQNARNQARRLRNMGYDKAQVVFFNGGMYAVVLVDRFVDLGPADDLANRLKSRDNVDAFVLEKR